MNRMEALEAVWWRLLLLWFGGVFFGGAWSHDRWVLALAALVGSAVAALIVVDAARDE